MISVSLFYRFIKVNVCFLGHKHEVREFMQIKKRKLEQEKLDKEQRAKERAEQLMENLRALAAKTNPISYK